MNRGPRGQPSRRPPSRSHAAGDRDRGAPKHRSAVERVAARRTESARTPYASNWRRVLAVDAGVGGVIFAVGVVLLFTVNVWIGAGVGALGASYVVLVARRYRWWQQLRRERGMD